MPGDNIEMEIKLITPIAIEEGLRFAIPRRRQDSRFGRSIRRNRIKPDGKKQQSKTSKESYATKRTILFC